MGMVIGIDFDNTLVTYDEMIHRVAQERGLVGGGVEVNKKQVRDAIRRLPGGETQWQKVQALVYGPRMAEARPAPGAAEFLQRCADNRAKVVVVSHKTEFANYDETGTNLREAARAWLDNHRLLSGPSGDVYFESTRQQKLERIETLGCTHFIDDLEETFLEQSFPDRVEKILYFPPGVEPLPLGVKMAGDWQSISEYLFDASP